MTKASWKLRDFIENPYPPKEDYTTFEELVLLNGDVIARIEQFEQNTNCFYCDTNEERSGCLETLEYARQWCEIKTKNNMN